MKSLQEFIFEDEHVKGPHGIFEMSQISDKTDQLSKNTEVWVYGEKDEQGTKPPHFHVMIDNKYEFEIKLSDIHTLDIWRSKTSKKDWNDYSKVKKELKKWFDKKNSEDPERTNLEVILTVWNLNNKNNRIDKKKFMDDYNKNK